MLGVVPPGLGGDLPEKQRRRIGWVLERMGLCHRLGRDPRALAIHDILTVDLGSGRSYPLNLSISISGGKETNRDCLSNGE